MSLLELFAIFFAVNLFTIGGGYVMIPMLHDIFVLQYQVLTQKSSWTLSPWGSSPRVRSR